jgi:hypothetical protein
MPIDVYTHQLGVYPKKIDHETKFVQNSGKFCPKFGQF